MEFERLGKYRLLAPLGRGGMGQVFEAEDPELARHVAIKVLPPEFADDEERMERFRREARAVAKLNHPNVITIHEINRHQDTQFLVMEKMSGGSLHDRLRAAGPLPWPEATRILAAACRGLEAAHRAGLIHRDLKPANILLGDDGAVKLADFGLVRVAGGSSPSLSQADAIKGTPDFMSPEQCQGEMVTPAADIYSLGATYYTLLVGRPPFPRDDTMQVLFAHCSSPRPDPRKFNAELPDACAAVVARAMATSPRDRFGSAAEMQRELEAISRPPPTAAAIPIPPPPPPPRQTAFPLPTVVNRDVSKRRAARRDGSPRRSPPPRWLVAAAIGGLALVAIVVAIVFRPPAERPANGHRENGRPENVTPATEAARESAWLPLFDDDSLTGWYPTPDGKAKWTRENGEIVGRGDYGYLFTRAANFADFHFRGEVKINTGGNSGLFFRIDSDTSLPKGYEAHIEDRFCGRLHRNRLPQVPAAQSLPEGMAIPTDQWSRLEVIAEGRHLVIKVNDTVVTDFTESTGEGPLIGHLALQVGNDKTEVHFRRLEFRSREATK